MTRMGREGGNGRVSTSTPHVVPWNFLAVVVPMNVPVSWSRCRLVCMSTATLKSRDGLHQPHLNRHLANGHLTLSSH